VLRRHRALPLWISSRGPDRGYELVVAFADPGDLGAVDDVAFAAGMAVRPVLAGPGDLAAALDLHFGRAPAPRALRTVAPVAVEDAPHGAMILEDVREYRLAA
jgi:hypothetical protein